MLVIPFDMLDSTQAAILLGIAALLGACLGSFINCLADRMVTGESVLKGRSHCPVCGHTLGPVDLVPLVSWLALRGRCRHCGARIGSRYVIVEAIMAVSFVLLVFVYGMGIPTLAYAALICVLMGAALVDLDTFTIPNGFIVAGMVIWLISVWFMKVPSGDGFGVGSPFVALLGRGWLAVALDGVLGAVVVGGGILVLSLAFDAVSGRRSLGGGDVKLLFMTGLFLGLAGSLLAVLVACALGLVFAFVRVLTASPPPVDGDGDEQRAGSFLTKAIPFGPAVAAAALFVLVAGPSVLGWYMGLF